MSLVSLIFIAAIVGLVIYGIQQDQRRRGGIPADVLRAAKGDKRLVQRLVENVKLRHPGKSERWYFEKVLYDLERDGAGNSGRGPKHR
ncbi:MAG: hypothetical protein RLZZ511_2475 [Cyanobacteriota bacterium]|jgi:hypothetical protein